MFVLDSSKILIVIIPEFSAARFDGACAFERVSSEFSLPELLLFTVEVYVIPIKDIFREFRTHMKTCRLFFEINLVEYK